MQAPSAAVRGSRSSKRTIRNELGGRGRVRRLHRRFVNRQIHEGGECGERDVGVPHPLIAAPACDRDSTQPCAEEGADLVREQRKPEERGEVADAEELADDRGGGRHGGEPCEAEPESEEVESRW